MLFGLKVAFRYLYSSKIQTMLLILLITLGVMIFVFITSLVSGLQQYITSRILGNIPHITLEKNNIVYDSLIKNIKEYKSFDIYEYNIANNLPQKQISDWVKIDKIIGTHDEVYGLSPQINGNAFIKHNNNIQPVMVNGILPERISAISGIGSKVISGNGYLAINSIIIGKLLADKIGVRVGQLILLQSAQGISKTFILQGIFRTGLSIIDQGIVYVDLKNSQGLFKLTNGVSRIEVKLKDMWKAQMIAKEIELLFQLKATSWQNTDYGINEALSSQSKTGNVIQAFSLIIIVVGVSSTLFLSVYRKKSDIGIMRSFGMSKKFIISIFLFQGLLISVVGTLMGCTFGYLLCSVFYNIKSPNGQSSIPLIPEEGGYLIVSILTIIGGGIAALIPARAAAKIEPIKAIVEL
ncbi:MAG: ABC transporter permease [Rickettsia endosymbiont of Culicoides impunctatus]|uniref:ABC transporter permease n=1 Tax=unclassified Candidatus Tisiphia TaxID=2996318 RepID=UPI001E7455B7|nr:MAG: ABC transporter permease [Rickettsia endosymbiont of Culicoides impunctatus]